MDKENSRIAEPIRLEYKEYTAILVPNSMDKNRLYGRPCSPGHPNEPMENYSFAGDNRIEAEKNFRIQVDTIIRHNEYRTKQLAWSSANDANTIGLVFDIMPDEFQKRISSPDFDRKLIEGVVGGDYTVPLYYVTKAWDILLKGTLDVWSFMIGPEEDDDFSVEALKEFMEEEGATRSRGQAIIDNDKMKALWKAQFGIDIDELDVDFTIFDMHIPPKAKPNEYNDYFLDVPDGIVEWMMCGINHPTGGVTFDSVSSLMEFAALIELVRQEKFCGFC